MERNEIKLITFNKMGNLVADSPPVSIPRNAENDKRNADASSGSRT